MSQEALQQLGSDVSRPGAAANKPRAGGAKAAWTAPKGPLAWLVKPKSALAVICTVLAAWQGLEHLLPEGQRNPLTPLVTISYALPPIPGDDHVRYGKGPLDLAFLAFYIVVFSFLRQSITEYLIRPLASQLGLRTEGKITRFMEQAYAVVYFSASGAFGLVRCPPTLAFSSSRAVRSPFAPACSTSCPASRRGGTRRSISGSATRTGAPPLHRSTFVPRRALTAVGVHRRMDGVLKSYYLLQLCVGAPSRAGRGLD